MARRVNSITDEEKRRIVEVYLQGGTTTRELGKAVGVGHTTIYRWVNSYKTNGTFCRYENVRKNKITTTRNESSIEAYKAENARLKAALEKAELRAHALDTMIDVAEETLNINIRKKAGAKQ